MAINVLFAGIPVTDLDAAIEWYERLLGRPPDMTPNEMERTWRLTDESWLYVVTDHDRAGKALVTVMVDDLDDRLAAIERRGIEGGQVRQINEQTRKVEFADSEGNRISFGQAG